jgi:hypothetical protein
MALLRLRGLKLQMGSHPAKLSLPIVLVSYSMRSGEQFSTTISSMHGKMVGSVGFINDFAADSAVRARHNLCRFSQTPHLSQNLHLRC